MSDRPWIVRVQWEGQERKLHFGPLMAELGDLRAVNCMDCGYTHLDPLPSQADLNAFYDAFYTGDGCKYEQEASQQWYWRRVYEERLREFDKLVRLAPAREWPCRLLDYGAGMGWFVYHAERWGWKRSRWDVFGYEPNVKAHPDVRQWRRGRPFPPFLYSHIDAEWERFFFDGFHAIHCSLVLEHVLDPLAELQQMYDLLRPGGVLCLVVPNEFNPLQVQLERFGYSPLHMTHVNYFTKASLTRLAERAGFEVIRRTATFPIEWFALHGLNYVRHRWAGKKCHMLRMIFEWGILRLAPRFKRRLYERWAARGIGREMEWWLRKPFGRGSWWPPYLDVARMEETV